MGLFAFFMHLVRSFPSKDPGRNTQNQMLGATLALGKLGQETSDK
jgi:hypothetical protein